MVMKASCKHAATKFLLVMATLFTMVSCSSSGPATSYYTLFADDNAAIVKLNKKMLPSMGVALVSLPGYLDNSAVVSIDKKQKLNVSGYHAWAEPLDEAATRVLASNLRVMLSHNVSGFPWDMRMRPDLQLRVQFQQFDGERGEEIKLTANWLLFDVKKQDIVQSGQFSDVQLAQSKNYASYVEALNNLLNALSLNVAESLSTL